MGISTSRASANLVKDVVKESGSREEFINSSDPAVNGPLNAYSMEDNIESSQEAVDAAAESNANELVASDVAKNLPANINSVTDSLGSALNQNLAKINTALSVTKSILCFDGTLPFSLKDIWNALDFNLNLSFTLNLCGRQGLTDPLDSVLRSINQLENEINMLKNLDKRLLESLRKSINNLIKNAGLPRALQSCMLNNSVLGTAVNLRSKTSLNDLRDIVNFLNSDICKKSDAGISPNLNSLTVNSFLPFIGGMENYPRETAYASSIKLLTTEGIDASHVEAAMIQSYQDKPNENTTKKLEMLLLAKALKTNKEDNKYNSIVNINTSLANSSDGAREVLDNAITAVESQDSLNKDDLLKLKNRNYIHIPKLEAKIVLRNMTDDYSSSEDPDRDLSTIKKLLEKTVFNYNADDVIGYISECKTIGTLLDMTIPNKKKDFEITNKNENVEQVSVDYLEIDNNEDAYFNAYLIKHADSQAEVEYLI